MKTPFRNQRVSVAMHQGRIPLLSPIAPGSLGPVTLSKIWTSQENGADRYNFESERFKGSRVLLLEIPGTYVSVLMVDGKPSPFLVDRDGYRKWDVYELSGLPSAERFAKANLVYPDSRTLGIILSGGDSTWIWVLDCSAPEKGLAIQYEYDGGF